MDSEEAYWAGLRPEDFQEDPPQLPEGVEVVRANGLTICTACGAPLWKHPKYRYPWGDNSAVKGCDGKYYHL